jgi:hypothetical protein
MTTPKDINIRQLILDEYRAGNTKEKAHSNLGPNSVSATTIDHWYTRFQSGNTSIVDGDTKQYSITRIIQELPNGKKGILL